MKRAFKYVLIGLILVLFLVAGSALWLINDDDWVKHQLEQYASSAWGRSLTMAEFELDWGLLTRIQVSKASLGNPDWASKPHFLSIDSLDAKVDLRHILSGVIVVSSLEVLGVTLDLEEDAAGKVNWDFVGRKENDDGDSGFSPIPWEHVQVTGFELTHHSPNRQAPLDFKVSSFSADKSPGGRVNLAGKGEIGGYPLGVDGYIDPLFAFVSGGSITASLQVTLGDISLSASGTASNAATGAGADLEGEFKGPEFAWILKQAALPEFSSGPFDAKASLKMTGDGTFAVALDGDLGSLKSKLNGELDRLRDPSRVEMTFDIGGPDLHALGKTFGLETLPTSPFDTQGDARYNSKTVTVSRLEARVGEDLISLSGTVGDWPALNGTRLNVAASGTDVSRWGPALHFEKWAPNAFSLKGEVSEKGGLIEIDEGQITVGESQLAVNGTLGAMPALEGARLEVDLKVPQLAALLDLDNFEPKPKLPIGLKGSLARNEKGVLFKDVKLEYGEDTLDFSGLLAFTTGDAPANPEAWQTRFSGSHITGRLETANAGQLAESFDIPSFPNESLSAGIDARLEQGQLTFSVAGANLGNIALDIEGNLDRLPDPELGQASFNIKLPSLKAVEAFTRARGLPDLPTAVQGSLQRFPQGLKLQNITGTVGEGKFEVDGELTLRPEFVLRNLRFSASGPDFQKFFDEPWLQGLPPDFDVSGQIDASDAGQALQAVSVSFGQARVVVNGTVDHIDDPKNFNLDVSLAGPNLTELNGLIETFTKVPMPKEAFNLGFKVTSADDVLDFVDIKAVLGKSKLRSSAKVTLGDVPDIKASVDSEYLDLSWLEEDEGTGAPSDLEDIVDDPAEAANGKEAPSRIFSDDPLPILSWDPMTVDLSLQVGTVQLSRTNVSNVQLGFKLTEHQLRIDPLDITSADGGHFAGSVTLKETSGNVDAEVFGTAKGLKLGLAAGKNQDISTYPPWDFRVDLKASGNSMQSLATTASGDVDVIVGKGQVAHNTMDVLFSDTMRQLIAKLNPFAQQSDHTNLECGVGVIQFNQGIAEVDPIIYQTDKIVITSKGQVNLATEKINLSFNTRARTGIGISPGVVINPFIKLGGTLTQPSISLAASRAALTSGAAVATSGLSLLGESLFDRFLRQRNPCGKVVEELRKMQVKEPRKP